MRKLVTFLMTMVVGTSISYATASNGQFSFEAGYRRDNISWEHNIPASDPVVSTKTKFKDLDIFQIGVTGRSTIGYNLYVRGNAYWGWILDGKLQQDGATYFDDAGAFDAGIAFSGNNRNVIDDRYVYGISAAIGYPFFFCDCTSVIAPVIGYSFDEQNLRIDGNTLGFGTDNGFLYPTSGSGCGCRHKFINKWYGPFVGVDFEYKPYNECWNLFAGFEYHWGSFRGRRNLDNGEYFHFFERHSHRSHNARGWVINVGADYDLCNEWTAGLAFKYQDWRAHGHRRGGDESNFGSFFFDSDSSYSGGHARQTHKWQSYEIKLALGHEF